MTKIFTLLRPAIRWALAALFILLYVFNPARGQTYVNGGAEGTWRKQGSPYVLNGLVRVEAGRTLVIEPGVEIKAMSFNAGLRIEGTLIAQGSATDSVRFLGFENASFSGSSHGGCLYFTASSVNSVLGYAVVDRWGDIFTSNGALEIATSSVKIHHSNIRNSENVGIYITDTVGPVLTENSFRGNPIAISGSLSNFTHSGGNVNANIRLRPEVLTGTSVLPRQGNGAFYELTGKCTIWREGKLEIKPGTEIRSMNYSAGLNVQGTLVARGTAADSVFFKGFANSSYPGSTHGGCISFEPGSVNSVLDYVSVNQWGDAQSDNAAILIGSSSLSISNCSVRNSEGNGIYNTAGGLSISSTVLSGNQTGFYNASGHVVLTGCRIFGNTSFGVLNAAQDTVDARNNYWGATSGPLHVSDNPQGTGNKVSDKVKFIPWNQQSVKLEQLVSLPHVISQYAGDTLVLKGSASSGLPLTYKIVTVPATGVAVLTADTLTFPGASGLVTVTASQEGNEYFKPASLEMTFNVLKRSQSIDFRPLSLKKVGDLPFAVVASASSGLPVNFGIVSGPATVKRDTITLTGPGIVIVEARQPGDAVYMPATPVQQQFTVYPDLPDLLVTDVISGGKAVLPGDSVALSWNVRNSGTAAAASDWNERIYIRDSGSGSLILAGTVAVAGGDSLRAGGVMTRKAVIRIPSPLMMSGDGAFVVELIPGTAVKEMPGKETNNRASEETGWAVKKALLLTLEASRLTEGGSGVMATVYRTGVLTDPLTVSVGLESTRLKAPASVVIPVGQGGASFHIEVDDDSKTEGTTSVPVRLSAPGFETASAVLEVLDNDLPVLSISGLPDETAEGQTLTFKVTASQAHSSALNVFLKSNNKERFPLPASVVIPAGSASADVTVSLAQDELPQIPVIVAVSAAAAGYHAVADTILINDDDLPDLELTVHTDLISEKAGLYAAEATVRRKGTVKPVAFTVNLSAGMPNTLLLPSSVTLAANENEKKFMIGVVDNKMVDGDRKVVITASVFVASCGCSVPPSSSGAGFVSASVTVADDDGPALTLEAPNLTLREGLAAAGTLRLSRNTAAGQPLSVSLSSSDIKEATVPQTIEIPAGALFVDVPVTTVNDEISDGSKQVYFKASADGFSPGSTWLVVTDANKPDLRVEGVTLSAESLDAASIFNYSIAVNNSGFATAPAGVLVRTYLSKDRTIDEADLLLSEDRLDEPVPAGETRMVLNAVKAPAVPGEYHLIAVVNPESSFAELVSTNNTSEGKLLKVNPEYSATAGVDRDWFLKGSTVTVTGQARKSDGLAAGNKEVDVYIVTNGLRRTLKAMTDAGGKFRTDFVPLPGEAGHYIVGASFPGVAAVAEQDAFDIVGVEVNGGNVPQFKTHLGGTLTGTLSVTNLSDKTLSNFNLSSTELPSGAKIEFGRLAVLAGMASAEIPYTVTGSIVSGGDNYEIVEVGVGADEGSLGKLDVYYYCQSVEGYLVADIAEVKTVVSQSKGEREVELKLINRGAGSTGDISVHLPQVGWLKNMSGETISPLSPGDTATVVLKFLATSDVPFNYAVNGTIVINAKNSLTIPFSFQKVAEGRGTAKVTVTNQFTYYTEGAPNVADAAVVIKNYYTGEVFAQGKTNSEGVFLSGEIPEGKYRLIAEKEKHLAYEGSIEINPGNLTEASVFLNYQAITFEWKVVPSAVQDGYEVTLETKFETNVPVPVVILDMPKEMPGLAEGEVFTFNATLTNHGLITAKEVKLNLPSDDPEYEFITNYQPSDLAAKSSIQVPVLMRRRGAVTVSARAIGRSSLAKSGGALKCQDYAGVVYWYYCSFFTGLWTNSGIGFHYSGRVCVGERETIPAEIIRDPAIPVGPVKIDGRTQKPVCYNCIRDCPTPGCHVKTEPKRPEPVVNQPNSSGDDGKPKTCTQCINDAIGAAAGCAPGKIAAGISMASCGLGAWLDDGGALDYAKCAPNFMPEEINCLNGAKDAINTCAKSMENTARSRAAVVSPGGRYGQIARHFEIVINAYKARENWAVEYFGDLVFLQGWNDVANILNPYIVTLQPVPDAEQKAVLNVARGFDMSDAKIQDFFLRWEQSLSARQQGVLQPDKEHPGIINWIAVKGFSNEMVEATHYAIENGFESVFDMCVKEYDALQDLFKQQSDAVCASVTVQFKQRLAMTREAFDGTLEIFNGHPSEAMKELSVNVEITDENGVPANGLFEIQTKSLDNLSDVTGTGQIGAQEKGSVQFVFIPENGAAPREPKIYRFGGSVTYRDPYAGKVVSLPLASVPLTVNPGPDLMLHYFMERNILGDDALTQVVEPSVPAELAVMVENHGYGPAVNMTVSSAEPKIVDNEKGLSIDFALQGSNFQGQAKKLGVTNVSFGTVPAQQSRIGQWYFTSSLLGKFVSYNASVVHNNSFGNPDLSLVKGVMLHELTKSIRVYGDPDDGINDFLVNDVFDVQDVPDRIYFSQGRQTARVIQAREARFSSAVSAPSFSNTLTVSPSDTGFNYVRLEDPGNRLFEIASITRGDGRQIPLANAWLTFVTLPVGRQPVYENKFHFVDGISGTDPVQYTVVWKPRNPGMLKVDSIFGLPPGVAVSQVKKVKVAFSKRIDPSSLSFEDLMLSFQGGPNLISPEVKIVQTDTATFEIDLGAFTTGNGRYTFTVQASEVRDVYGNKGDNGKQEGWSQFLTVPAIEEFRGIPRSGLVSRLPHLDVLFNLPVDLASVSPEQFSLKRGGALLTGSLTIDSVSDDHRLFRLSGFDNMLGESGEYELTVALPSIRTVGQVAGLEPQSLRFTADLSGPSVTGLDSLGEGRINSQHVPFAVIRFSERVSGFNISSVSLKRNGEALPLRIDQLSGTDLQSWKAGNFGMLTYPAGRYTFRVDASGIKDEAGNSGSGSREVSWTVDYSAKTAVTRLNISPDLGDSDADGITSGQSFTADLVLSAPARKVTLVQEDASGETEVASLVNLPAGPHAVPFTSGSGGSFRIKAVAEDDAGAKSTMVKTLFVDSKPLTAHWLFSSGMSLNRQPDSIQVVFSAKLSGNKLPAGAIVLSGNGVTPGAEKLKVDALNDSVYAISGIRGVSATAGAYSLSLDLRLLSKALSGKRGETKKTAEWKVLSANRAPLAHAGDDILVPVAGNVSLNGSLSTDPDKDSLSYHWTAPEGVVLNDPADARPVFKVTDALQDKRLKFLLTVSDGDLFSTDVVYVVVKLLPPVAFNGLSPEYCSNSDASVLSGTPEGGSFAGPGIAGNRFDPSAAGAGTHTITYTAADGRSSSQSVVVLAAPAPVITPQGPLVFRKGSSIRLSTTAGQGFTYQWQKDGVPIATAVSADYTASEAGVYTVRVSSASCSAVAAPVVLEEVFGLPADNFRISVTGESCKTADNGSISISAVREMNYTATLTGGGRNTSWPFSSAKEISGLAAGSYTLCISVEGKPAYRQCFDVVITEPKDLSVYTTVSNTSRKLTLTLDGGTTYRIDLNGQHYTTSAKSITLDLSKGNNRLRVMTDKDCQGTFEKSINVSEETVYPNPFERTVYVKLRENTGAFAEVALRNVTGQVVYSGKLPNNNGILTLELPADLSQGIYFLHIKTDITQSVHKLIRK